MLLKPPLDINRVSDVPIPDIIFQLLANDIYPLLIFHFFQVICVTTPYFVYELLAYCPSHLKFEQNFFRISDFTWAPVEMSGEVGEGWSVKNNKDFDGHEVTTLHLVRTHAYNHITQLTIWQQWQKTKCINEAISF